MLLLHHSSRPVLPQTTMRFSGEAWFPLNIASVLRTENFFYDAEIEIEVGGGSRWEASKVVRCERGGWYSTFRGRWCAGGIRSHHMNIALMVSKGGGGEPGGGGDDDIDDVCEWFNLCTWMLNACSAGRGLSDTRVNTRALYCRICLNVRDRAYIAVTFGMTTLYRN